MVTIIYSFFNRLDILLKDVHPIDNRHASPIIQRYRGSFDCAYNRTLQVGYSFAHFVLERTDRSTAISVCCNGAEHLGTMIEEAALVENKNVKVTYNYLTKRTTGAWRATLDDERLGICAIGLLKKPPRSARKVYCIPPSNKPEDLAEHLREIGALRRKRLLIVETGFRATIPEAAEELARLTGYNGMIEATVFHYDEGVPKRKVPVHAFTTEREWPASRSITNLIDDGILDGWGIQSYPDCFRKSRESPTRLVRENGQWEPDTPLHSSRKEVGEYKATVLGIRYAIRGWSPPSGHLL